MVQLKVTDGRTTRRFPLQPGKDSYKQLKQRLATFFPECMKDDQEMQLHYTDSDGDLITVTTDLEFQEALKQLPPQSVWKIHVHSLQSNSQNNTPTMTPAGDNMSRRTIKRTDSSPFHQMLGPSRRCRTGRLNRFHPWNGAKALLHRNSWLNSPFSASDIWFQDPFSLEMDRDVEIMENLLDTFHQEAVASKAAAQPRERTSDERSQTDVVSTGDSSVVPGLRVHKFGTWEPRHYEGEYGSRTVIGPVGYYASWGYGEDEEEDHTSKRDGPQEGGDKTKEGEKKEEAAASNEAEQ